MADNYGYKRKLQKLLPEGLAWEGDEISNIAEGFAEERSLIHGKVLNTYNVEADPRTTVLYLPEWLETMEPYGGSDQPASVSDATTRATLVEKTQRNRNNSPDHLIQLAVDLGFSDAEILIADLPFRMGSRIGDPLGGGEAAYVITIEATSVGVDEDAALQTTIRDAVRLHTRVLFNFL